MKQSGLQNLIYLVESHGDNRRTSLPLDTLTQAAINTQVVNMFTVKITSSHRDSMRYLSVMTRHLSASYCDKTFVSCHRGNLPCCHIRDDLISLMTFSEFNKSSCKTKVIPNLTDTHMSQSGSVSTVTSVWSQAGAQNFSSSLRVGICIDFSKGFHSSFIQNVANHLQDYMASQPRTPNSTDLGCLRTGWCRECFVMIQTDLQEWWREIHNEGL